RGWALFGIVIFAAIGANLALAVTLKRRRAPFWLNTMASLLLACSLVVFFLWTYPANHATNNWTMTVPDWEKLRKQWEFSHAANAVLTFIALCCATAAATAATAPSPAMETRKRGRLI